MRKSCFTETQIVQILSEHDAGASMADLARRHGLHANTIRLWRQKYAGMNATDLARLKQLEAENAQMQRIIARQTVKIDAVEELLRKHIWSSRQVLASPVSCSAKRKSELIQTSRDVAC